MSTKTHNIHIIIEQIKNYCTTQDRCKWDVIQKTKSLKLPEVSTNQILDLLIKEEYLNEERYSKSFCRGKFRIKKWGKIKITYELKKKDISSKYISIGLKEIDDNEYQQELDQQYQKKKNSIKEKNEFIKKL